MQRTQTRFSDLATLAIPAAGGMLAFESADHPLDAWIKRALEICKDHGGMPEMDEAGSNEPSHRSGAAGAWPKSSMFRTSKAECPEQRPAQGSKAGE
jgi:hypothetical protein